MTSLRQIMSNRRNALKSTGPKTDEGKRRSSQNARRHGLTAETVIEPIEDQDDYMAFEASVTAEYDAETVVERELVLRLASLLWRLRRAGAIETGLMRIEAEDARRLEACNGSLEPGVHSHVRSRQGGVDEDRIANGAAMIGEQAVVEIARSFVRLPAHAFALLCRYEGSLWRQVRQTVFTLERKHRKTTARDWRTDGRHRKHCDPLADDVK